MFRVPIAAALLALPFASSCGSRGPSPDSDGGSCADGSCNFPFSSPDEVSSIPSGTPVIGGWHVAEGTAVTYDENPPVGGYHYPVWAVWGTHSDAVPLPYLVHNLEHGGVLLLYNCDAGCPDLVTQLQGVIDSQPQDPFCTSEGTGVIARVLLAPAPSLDVRFAAASWGWWYKPGDGGVSTEAVQAFIDAHTGQGREAECAQGGYQ